MNLRPLLLLFFLFLIKACDSQPNYIHLQGYTMGTTYNIKAESLGTEESLHKKIEERLNEINQLMSTYIDDSELSVFNATTSKDCIPLSNETIDVIRAAKEVSESTNGKFDVTLAPLIETWGFDKKNTNNTIPTQSEIDEQLSQIGYSKIEIKQDCISKANPSLSINLSAIAKGFGVDEIARLVERFGHQNYMVEIGGEVIVKGKNSKGNAWTVAIESASTANRSIQRIVALENISIATSGSYRNYFEKNGKRYSHTIDPTSGYPIEHNLASVTVLHKENMMADAIATAMMVMGAEASMAYAEKHGISVFMLVKVGDKFEERLTPSFKPFIKQ